MVATAIFWPWPLFFGRGVSHRAYQRGLTRRPKNNGVLEKQLVTAVTAIECEAPYSRRLVDTETSPVSVAADAEQAPFSTTIIGACPRPARIDERNRKSGSSSQIRQFIPTAARLSSRAAVVRHRRTVAGERPYRSSLSRGTAPFPEALSGDEVSDFDYFGGSDHWGRGPYFWCSNCLLQDWCRCSRSCLQDLSSNW